MFSVLTAVLKKQWNKVGTHTHGAHSASPGEAIV